MQLIPPEVLAMVFQYLCDKDISNCSKVCYKWREEINRNELWKRLSIQNGWADNEDKTAILGVPANIQHVKPYLNAPEPKDYEGTRLSPLCPWYLDFLESAHTYKNWRKGKYVIQNFDKDIVERDGEITAIDVNGDFVALGTDVGVVTLWKSSRDKLRMLHRVLTVFSDGLILNIFLENFLFGVIQMGLVQVFHKSNDKYCLCFVKALIRQEIDVGFLRPHNRAEDWFYQRVYNHFEEDKLQCFRVHNEPLLAFWGTVKSVDIISLKTPNPKLKILNFAYNNFTVNDVALHSCGFLAYISLSIAEAQCLLIEYNFDQNVFVRCVKMACEAVRVRVSGSLLVSLDIKGKFTFWSCRKEGVLGMLASSDFSVSPEVQNFEIFGNLIRYESNCEVGSILFDHRQIRHDVFEIAPPAEEISKGLGDVIVFINNKSIEVWDRSRKVMLYHIPGIVTAEDLYDARGSGAVITVLGLHAAPTLIWFW